MCYNKIFKLNKLVSNLALYEVKIIRNAKFLSRGF